MFGGKKYHAIRVDPARCTGCTHCMKACPTEAIRIRNGLAVITDERCVDCGNCMRVCPVDAFYILQDDLSQMERYRYRVALFPSVMIGQFPDSVREEQVYGALLQLGFTHLFEVEQPIGWIAGAYREYAAKEMGRRPLISTFCPAIVRLIQIRYPVLADQLMLVKAPHDMAALFALEQLRRQGASREETGLFYIAPCSAKIAAVKSPLGEKESVVNGILNMDGIYNRVMQMIATGRESLYSGGREYLTREGILWCLPRGEARLFKHRAMAIDGILNVVKVLENLETGELPGVDFMELRSCDQGCAGGVLLSGDRFMNVERLARRARNYPRYEENTPAEEGKQEILRRMAADPIAPQPVFRLDSDRQKALKKMARAERIAARLPGIDCGACGAPGCRALAMDIVTRKARISDCIFYRPRCRTGDPAKNESKLDQIWGPDRFFPGKKQKKNNHENS